jgi:aryl-alcohol dehydrogenase-like predicted oxidoreductase
MASKKNRDLMFVATKYVSSELHLSLLLLAHLTADASTRFTTPYRNWELGKGKTVNYSGNHKKSLHLSVRDSLLKLQTDYIDLLYLHWWDWTTSIEEVMDSLHILVESGKVLYLGISDTPAWVVSAANYYAKAHGKTPFSVYQGRWNVMIRDFERDIIPMCRHFGMALAPWDVIGGGKFQSKKQIEERKKAGEGLRSMMGQDKQNEQQEKVSAALEKVAGELGKDISLSAVALAYTLQKTPNVFPIIGGRKVEHLQDNIKALSIKLSDEQIKYLEEQTSFDIGFPNNFVGESPFATGQTQFILAGAAKMGWPTPQRPVGH